MTDASDFERPRTWSELVSFLKKAAEAFIGRSHQWVAGETMDDALRVAKESNGRGMERIINAGARIRLVKGAYAEPPEVSYATREEIDRAYLSNLDTLFRQGRDFAVASHDTRMIDRALDLARDRPPPFDFEMLQGVRDPLHGELVGKGQRVAEYISYGPKWLPYFGGR